MSVAMAVPVHDKVERVLLVLNKHGADDDFIVDRSFSEIDAKAMEIFAVELGSGDAGTGREVHYSERDAFMSQLLDFRESWPRKRAPSRGGASTPDTPHRGGGEINLMRRRGSIQRVFLMPWGLEILPLTKQGLVDLCVNIFRDVEVLELFGLEEDQVCSFVQAACVKYQDVPYHNFCHAIHVLHATYMLVLTGEALECLSPLDRLTLLIAAVRHEII